MSKIGTWREENSKNNSQDSIIILNGIELFTSFNFHISYENNCKNRNLFHLPNVFNKFSTSVRVCANHQISHTKTFELFVTKLWNFKTVPFSTHVKCFSDKCSNTFVIHCTLPPPVSPLFFISQSKLVDDTWRKWRIPAAGIVRLAATLKRSNNTVEEPGPRMLTRSFHFPRYQHPPI